MTTAGSIDSGSAPLRITRSARLPSEPHPAIKSKKMRASPRSAPEIFWETDNSCHPSTGQLLLCTSHLGKQPTDLRQKTYCFGDETPGCGDGDAAEEDGSTLAAGVGVDPRTSLGDGAVDADGVGEVAAAVEDAGEADASGVEETEAAGEA